MTAPMNCQIVGRWRIVEGSVGSRRSRPGRAYIDFSEDGRGEFAFGTVNGGMVLEYAHRMIFFTWAGFDEMDEVDRSVVAEPRDDGALVIEIAFDLDDEAVLEARRATSSTARQSNSR